MLFDVQFKHKVKNNRPELEYFRCIDISTGGVICEDIDAELVWHVKPPNRYIRLVVEERHREILRSWFLQLYGIWPKIDLAARSAEEIANDFKMRQS